jgi:hypothetical protein
VAAVDEAVAGDDPVGRRLAALQPADGVVHAGVDAQLGERAGIHQPVDALARGELARRVLALDALGAAAQPGGLTTLAQVVGERAQDRGGRRVRAHGERHGRAQTP